MNPDSTIAKARLQGVAHAKDKIRRRRWLASIGTTVVLALVAFAVIDYCLLLPIAPRAATSAFLLIVAGLGMWRLRCLRRSPTSLKEAALDAEAVRKETDCVVSTAAEYASGKQSTGNIYEPELAAALQSVAGQRLETVHTPYRRTLHGPAAALTTALTMLVVFIVVTPGSWTALERIALPWLGAHYTHVEVQPRNIEVPLGQSVEISGKFFGRPPRRPQLHWHTDGSSIWQTASMMKTSDGEFVYPFTNVTVAVKYRVSGGDALSSQFQLTPYIPPAVNFFSVGLAYPEYTRLKPLAQSSPDITILRGSTATFRLRANVGLSAARMRFPNTNMPSIDLRKAEGNVWSCSLTIATNTDYLIELFDQKGRPGRDKTLHHVVATTDDPPKVEILEPGRDMRADATNKIPIRVSVADDYGVSGISVVFHKLNTPEQSVVCQTESTRNGEWIATAELNLAQLGLKRYDVVAYHAEARDNNTLDGPGIGRSSLYFVEITDKQSAPAPPMQPMPSDQINLIVVQKQIIADTMSLNSSSSATNYFELALRQTNALQLGRLYLTNMAGAQPDALVEMRSALASMEQAIAPLNKADKPTAVPLEEAALAHLYQVLALMPDTQMLAVKPKPQMPKEQKPQTAVALREIRKPAPESPAFDPEIETALEEAKELSRAQAELNALGEKLAKAERPSENAAEASAQTQPPPSNAQGEGKNQGAGQGNGQGQGQGQAQAQKDGQGQGQGEGQGKGQESREKPAAPPVGENPLAKTTNSANLKQPSLAQAPKDGSTNNAINSVTKPQLPKPPGDVAKQTPTSGNAANTNAFQKSMPFAQLQNGTGQGTKPGKGQAQGNGKGKGKGAGQKGKGKGQGIKPGNGSGQPSNQQNGQPPEMAADDPNNQSEPNTPEELAEKEEELSVEAKALGKILQRLAGKGTRVGHNLAFSANKAAEHMEGAAQALKQGNAAGAGRRGTMSSAELDQLVKELERLLGKRPALTDVASEQAPKEYEDFISEYFKKLSYEK